MEALQKTLSYRGDTGPYRKLLADKDIYSPGKRQDESKYMDLDDLLDMKSEGTKTVKVTFTGEGSQLAIFKCQNEPPGDQKAGDRELQDTTATLPAPDRTAQTRDYGGEAGVGEGVAGDLSCSSDTPTSSEVPEDQQGLRDGPESPADKRGTVTGSKNEIVARPFKAKSTSFEIDELAYTDLFLNRKSESESSERSLEPSDHYAAPSAEDESHYITTHEIQLSELDHDVDYDFGVGSCWDFEDDNLVYSFVDYASFDSDETVEGRQTLEDRPCAPVESQRAQANNTARRSGGGAAVSTKLEPDPCDTDKCASSDESLSKTRSGSGNSAGQIHLSIKTTSRAINEPSNARNRGNSGYDAKPGLDMSCYVFKNTGAKAEPGRDSARCFIAAPGRMHFGGKLKGKDIHEYSSGASSAVSELDDADKEVRNLTARAFRSLACPYFDAINFSTSSDSSASEHGLGINRWSTFVDLKYGNMTQSREQNMVAHKSSTSTFEINKNADAKGIRGLALGHLKAPQTKIFALNGNAAQPQTAATSSQKIELKGEFEPGQSGVITLTETLNFRCNVKAGVPESERRAKCAENVAGSRSADEVTDTLPSELGCEASKHSCNTGEAMDGTHKKAIFASSLLKNVISKKMQFEQERKMERGEISESCPGLSPCLSHKEPETQRERAAGGDSRALQRQTSRFSEAGSDFTVVSVGEIEDVTDSKPCDLKENGQKEDALTLASETNFEACGEAAVDTKKGVSDATKSTLLRSQNSAFRSWREGELEFQKEYRNDKTAAGKSSASETDKQQQGTVDGGKSTKMSHLFVPSIQLLSKELEEGKPQANKKYSTRPAADLGGGGKLGSDNTLYVPDANRSVVTSKSPEIKISLRTVKDHKHNPFNIAKLLTPNIGCKVANLIKTADDSRCQALAASLKGEPSEKVPHFMVRDIRDNKCKLQTPIHQVRDVRKLVKSSYHFVSLDGNENKAHSAGDLNAEHKPSLQGVSRNPASLSPIVIKCQSVNTNSAEKPAGDLAEGSKHRLAEDCSEAERCSPPPPAEGARNGAVLVHRTTGRVPLVSAAKQPKSDTSEVPPAVKIETRAAKRKQEKISETMDKKPESQMVNQAALEKLKAAVKTMEQLYVFDRNEWKRKTEPRPITDSHVLSLITSEEQGSGRTGMEGEEEGSSVASSAAAAGNAECLVRRNSYPNADRSPPRPSPGGLLFEASPKKEAKECLKTFHIPFGREDRPLPLPPSGASKNVFTFSNSQKAPPTAASISSKVPPPFTVSQVPFNTKSFVPKSPKAPLSLKISAARPAAAEERATVDGVEADRVRPAQPSSTFSADSENYLTIPVKPQPGEPKPAPTSGREQTAVYTFTTTGGRAPAASPPRGQPRPADPKRHEHSSQSPRRSSVVMETRSPDTPTATIYHHSLPLAMSGAQPQLICFSPSMPPHAPPVDHFQQTQRKMLLDPTTGHYYLVDTPVQPATKRLFDPETGQYVDIPMPQQPMTPVPMSPLALSPGAYGPTYMIYPGFLPTTTVLPARTLQSQLSSHSEADEAEKSSSKETLHMGQHGEVAYMESPYYIPTGKPTPVSQHVTARGAKGFSDGKPVISITSQQGPRIIAPPSFDGTTMSFVVEHR